MRMELAAEFARVLDDKPAVRMLQRARVADLSAGFRVERRAVENERAVFVGTQRIDAATVAQDRNNSAAVRFQRFVTKKFCRSQLAGDLCGELPLALETTSRARTRSLFLHCALEAIHVHAQAALARYIGGQVDRKAVGVVEAKGILAKNRI